MVGRARELNAAGLDGDAQGTHAAFLEADSLLGEARRRGEPRIVAQLLRHSASIRLARPEFAKGADPLLDELLTHARRHGLVVLQADAHALRGRRALMGGSEDTAINETASGMALLDGEPVPDTTLGRRSWDRLMATSLIDIGLVLTQLGVDEMADQVMARAHQRIRESGGPHEITVHMINRCRLLLGWGLRLERIGQHKEAQGRFQTAADMAYAVEGPWRESLYPRVANRPAAEQIPVLGAARALWQPDGEHIERLRLLRGLNRATPPREKIIVAIAMSRCMIATGLGDQAVRLLSETRMELNDDTSEPTLRISLAREYAHLAELDGDATSAALQEYALELETELWLMREARFSTLVTRLENERLTTKHDAITQQALQDPLTGLSNRRALDGRLDAMLREPGNHPLSIALVDLDGFKEVNDRCSHAEGDDVLRVVASTLRDTLRSDDFLARYGGDEFVVLLPGATLESAEHALQRTAEAVEALPKALSRSVTLSIGTVAVRPEESSSQVLARADTAMYQAKRAGGNRVATLAERDENA